MGRTEGGEEGVDRFGGKIKRDRWSEIFNHYQESLVQRENGVLKSIYVTVQSHRDFSVDKINGSCKILSERLKTKIDQSNCWGCEDVSGTIKKRGTPCA